jgi:hypothetical protein
MQYAIGGSMGPSLKSESNLFIAPKVGSKEVIKFSISINLNYLRTNENAFTKWFLYTFTKHFVNYIMCIGNMEKNWWYQWR